MTFDFRRMVLLASALVLSAALSAGEKVVQSTGRGDTYRAAVNDALNSALAQECGVVLTSEEQSRFAEASSFESSGRKDGEARQSLNDRISRDFRKRSDGRINGYDVVSEDVDPTTGKCRVTLAVRFAGAYKLGQDPGNRRRMVVANFRAANGDTFSWCGKKESTAMWAATAADKLNERLTQTRKFTMIDRKFDAEVQNEVARLSDKNAAKGDVVRLGQRIGTDYMLVGDVRFGDIQPPAVNPVTGQAMPMASQRFAEISYRVILAPTGQLKWSDSVVVESGEVPAADMLSFVSASAELAACRIADAVMANLLPFEVVGRNAAGEVVIGEGGKSLGAGERLTVFVLGEVVKDSRTGEVLDRIEEPVGTVEIVRVTPKLSYARVIEGDEKKVTAGARLRRPQVLPAQQGAQPAAAPALNTSVRGTPTGGVITSF